MEKFLNVTKNFINFVKHNWLLLFAAFWFADFLIGLITINPSTLDATTRKIKALELGSDLLWALILCLEHSIIKTTHLLNKRITLVEAEVGFMYDTIRKAVEVSEKEKEAADKEEKSVGQK